MAANYSESEAVAKDFQEALEDISTNARYEIANLTVIARENTEHALAISGALLDHIKRVAPHKKLPCLYVLDSIAKNVGTPYTLFFGRRLYQTFMDAYASVDMPTRRKMDEMLKTWKEPVPGSIDTRSVFAPDIVRPIENALIKARTNALQAQQGRGQHNVGGRGRPGVPPGMPPGVPYRETPTPPQAAYAYPPHQPTPPGHQPPHQNHHLPSRSTPQPGPALAAFQPPPGIPQTAINIDALNDDIQRLIMASEAQLAHTPHDPGIITRLKALRDLQTILQTQNLPQDQVVLIKNQIAELAVTIRAPPTQVPTPVLQPQPVAVAPPPAAAPKVSLDSLLGPGALAAIMARSSATPQPPTPQPPAIRSPPPRAAEPPRTSTAKPSNPLALMEALRKAGMLPGAAPSAVPAAAPPLVMPSLPLPFPFPGGAPPPFLQKPGPQTLEGLANDITLDPSSLKRFRPQILPFLFEGQGPQCTQCGRRFTADDEGKKKKMAHMDWHFKVNRRITESEKTGQHRSWYVDKTDWINSREVVDKDHVVEAGEEKAAAEMAASKGLQLQYIPVPDDPVLANSVCPICQEKFETRWLDDAQEFVWPDAIQVGDRIYHASCHREATRDEVLPSAFVARSTPDRVLGKRKAEDELVSLRGKMKMETA